MLRKLARWLLSEELGDLRRKVQAQESELIALGARLEAMTSHAIRLEDRLERAYESHIQDLRMPAQAPATLPQVMPSDDDDKASSSRSEAEQALIDKFIADFERSLAIRDQVETMAEEVQDEPSDGKTDSGG